MVSRAELLTEKVAPDWTASGLLGLVTGKKHDPNRNTVLLEVSPNRVYVTQSGVVGGNFPNHRTPFTVVDGPRELAPGQDTLPVTFVSESDGVRVTKTYTFHRGRHDIEVTHKVENIGEAPVTPSVYLQIVRDGNKPEGESSLYYTYTGPGRLHGPGEVQEGRVLGHREEQARAAERGRQRLGRHDPALLRHGVGAGEGRAPVLRAQRRQEPVLDRHAAAARHRGARRGGDRQGDAVHRAAEPAGARGDRAWAGPRRRLRLADLPREADLLAAGVPAPPRRQLGLGDRAADRADQGGVLPAVGGELQVDGEDEGSDAAADEAARAVRQRQAEAEHGDDGAVSQREDQPARRLPADPGADPRLHLALLGAARQRRDAQRAVDRCG